MGTEQNRILVIGAIRHFYFRIGHVGRVSVEPVGIFFIRECLDESLPKFAEITTFHRHLVIQAIGRGIGLVVLVVGFCEQCLVGPGIQFVEQLFYS